LRMPIFHEEAAYEFFLSALGRACQRTGWRVHAWALLGNHYHLFLETPEPNLVEGMKWLQNVYTRHYNNTHRKWGRVFGDRYKSVLVEGESDDYFITLTDYIHLNPVRAGLVSAARKESVLDYPWSSLAGGYALLPGKRPSWLAAEEGVTRFGYRDTVAGRRKMVERLDERALAEGAGSGVVPLPDEVDARMSHLRRGWYWGRQEFAEKALKWLGQTINHGKSRAYRRSVQKQAHGVEVAEKWIAEGWRAAGLQTEDRERLPGADLRKVALAKMVWEGTTVSQSWLAERLGMSSAANVSQLLRRSNWKKMRKNLPKPLIKFMENENG